MSLAARWSLLTLLLAPVIDGGPIPGHRHKAPVRVVDAEGRHRGPTLCLGDLTALSPRASMRFDDRRALRLCHRIVPGPCPYARPAGVVGCRTPRPLRRSARRRRRVAGGSVERPSTPRWWTPETCPALRSASGKTCPVRRTGERPKTCEVREDWCGSPVFRGPRNPLPPGRCAVRLLYLCWSELESRSGGGRESNPPGSFRPHTGFEGMSDARAAFRPVTSVFVFGRRPRTCKDL